ncbi:MAG: hypothetical protein LUO89_05080 [Methanothrix sp.]|nr:hypothetical protein [Methanothrix sp.]
MSQAVSSLALHGTVIEGVNATTQTLTGIGTDDTILFAGHFTPGATSTFADVTTHMTISAADEITVDADYSSDFLAVVWSDGSPSAGANQPQSNLCLRFSLIAGSDTTATITGITTSDVIVGVFHWSTAADITAFGTLSDVTITAANTVTFATGTAADSVLIIWQDMDSGATPQAYSSMCLHIDLVDGHATEMAVTGMVATDVILFAGHLSTKANITTIADYTTGVTAAAGKVTYAATTADDQIWLWWLDTSA